jgi:hypothetical protein
VHGYEEVAASWASSETSRTRRLPLFVKAYGIHKIFRKTLQKSEDHLLQYAKGRGGDRRINCVRTRDI